MKPSDIDLGPFLGGVARLWDFSPSHDRLVFRLSLREAEAYLVLSGCESITTSVAWRLLQPSLGTDPPWDGLVFTDGSVRVLCKGANLLKEYED